MIDWILVDVEYTRGLRDSAIRALRQEPWMVPGKEHKFNWDMHYLGRLGWARTLAAATSALQGNPDEVREALLSGFQDGMNLMQMLEKREVRQPDGRRALVDVPEIPAEHALLTMEMALGLANIKLAQEAAAAAPDAEAYVLGHPTTRWLAGAVKYAILDDKSNARRCIEGVHNGSRHWGCRPVADMYSALVDEDENEVKRRFADYIAWFKKQLKPGAYRYYRLIGWMKSEVLPDTYMLSMDGLGFCNLAASRGIKIEVDEPFLPKELLVSPGAA